MTTITNPGHLNDNAAAAVARDATRLEPQVCFFLNFVFYFITLILFLGLLNTSKRQWEQQQQLATHDLHHHDTSQAAGAFFPSLLLIFDMLMLILG